MFGFILGTLCLIALVSTLARRRYGPYRFAHAHGYGGSWHGYGHGYGSGPGWSERGPRRRGGFRRIFFERFDTTPGQEKAIAKAFDDARERVRDSRSDLETARRALADAVRGDVVDGARLDAALDQQKILVERLGRELTQLLLNVHEVLDSKQRQKLADLIADGPGWRGLRHL
jgi:Spy/CpxP family protein refolding chaperone